MRGFSVRAGFTVVLFPLLLTNSLLRGGFCSSIFSSMNQTPLLLLVMTLRLLSGVLSLLCSPESVSVAGTLALICGTRCRRLLGVGLGRIG